MTPLTAPSRSVSGQALQTVGPRLIAYAIDESIRVPIIAGTQHRPMFDAPGPTFAVRCLPMLIGNQGGWLLMNPIALSLTWNGGADPSDVEIQTDSGVPHPLVQSTGGGHVVWRSGYVFQTDPGWNLIARAPANWPRRGVYGFDSRYETGLDPALDSSRLYEVTFAWQVLEPNVPIVVRADEPFGMIVPYRPTEDTQFSLVKRPVSDDEHLQKAHLAWNHSRAHFKSEMTNPVSACRRESWQKDYFRGHQYGGGKFPEHQTKLRLGEFQGCPVASERVRDS